MCMDAGKHSTGVKGLGGDVLGCALEEMAEQLQT